MAKRRTKGENKFHKVMSEFKTGTLHSGRGGPMVKDMDQALAIAFSEKRRARHKS